MFTVGYLEAATIYNGQLVGIKSIMFVEEKLKPMNDTQLVKHK